MTILITGATANIGRRLVDELLARGVSDLRALTVDPGRARLPQGVETAVGTIHRPDTVEAALVGISTLYLAPHPPTAAAIIDRAKAAGVKRVVALTGPKGSDWVGIDPVVQHSGMDWTLLQPGEFYPNALMWADQLRQREVREVYPDSANAMIDAGDIAIAAATVICDDRHNSQAYLLTGPQTLTKAEKIRLMAEAAGIDVRLVEIDPESAVAELEPTMGEYARWYVEMSRFYTEEPQQVEPHLERLIGRAPVSFADWAAANADAWR